MWKETRPRNWVYFECKLDWGCPGALGAGRGPRGQFRPPLGWWPQQLVGGGVRAFPTHFGGRVGARKAAMLGAGGGTAGTRLPRGLNKRLKLGALIPLESRTGNNASQGEAKRSICPARRGGGGGAAGGAAGTGGPAEPGRVLASPGQSRAGWVTAESPGSWSLPPGSHPTSCPLPGPWVIHDACRAPAPEQSEVRGTRGQAQRPRMLWCFVIKTPRSLASPGSVTFSDTQNQCCPIFQNL